MNETEIMERLSELRAKQEAAPGWGAAVGARHEEIKELEARLSSLTVSLPVTGPDITGFSVASRDSRCLEVWFRVNVTNANREWLREAINEKAARPGAAQSRDMREAPVAWRMRDADGYCTSWFDGKPPNLHGPYECAYAAPSPALDPALIKHMVDRFLGWKLPVDFKPDCGIVFNAPSPNKFNPRTPYGTNLFDATQADAMVRYMVDGAPSPALDPATVKACAKICERAALRIVREGKTGDTVATFCAQQVRALLPSGASNADTSTVRGEK